MLSPDTVVNLHLLNLCQEYKSQDMRSKRYNDERNTEAYGDKEKYENASHKTTYP